MIAAVGAVPLMVKTPDTAASPILKDAGFSETVGCPPGATIRSEKAAEPDSVHLCTDTGDVRRYGVAITARSQW
jgi:hypothetical protein